MATQIDFRTIPANVPVMCIPRVYPNITESRIRKIFDDLNMGTLDHIDIVTKINKKGEKFNRVFVHMRQWNQSSNACQARERLLNGKEIKIIYDEPWFWKISAYREVECRPQPKYTNTDRKATIDFDSDESPRQNSKAHHDESHDRRPTQRRNDLQRDSFYQTPKQVRSYEQKHTYHSPRSPSNSPPRQSKISKPVTEVEKEVKQNEEEKQCE
jgi:hypothetical protein